MNKEIVLGMVGLGTAALLVITTSIWLNKDAAALPDRAAGPVPDIVSVVTGQNKNSTAVPQGLPHCLASLVAMMCRPVTAMQQDSKSFYGNGFMVCPTGLKHAG